MDGKKLPMNPDWEEWLMDWPIGITDIERQEVGEWMDLTSDPAELTKEDARYIPRVTSRRSFRCQRIKLLGNGQEPISCAYAFEEGLVVLEVYRREKRNERSF